MNFSGRVNSESRLPLLNKLKGKRGVITKLFFSTIPGIHQRCNISITNRKESYEA